MHEERPERIANGIFALSQKAKSKGGDRYKGELKNDKGEFSLDVYVPQSISRGRLSEPVSQMQLFLTSADFQSDGSSNSVCLRLMKEAKAKGGDKYEGRISENKITMYLPQELSRLSSSSIRNNISLTFMRTSSVENYDDKGGDAELEAITESKDQCQREVITTADTSSPHQFLPRRQEPSLATGYLSLKMVAKSKGGDRYSGTWTQSQSQTGTAAATFPLDVYIPQTWSRQTENQTALPKLQLSLSLDTDDSPSPDRVVLHLCKAAKAKGGDKYEGSVQGEGEQKLSIYIPQELSRGAMEKAREVLTLMTTNSSSQERDGDISLVGVKRKAAEEGKDRGACSTHDMWLCEVGTKTCGESGSGGDNDDDLHTLFV